MSKAKYKSWCAYIVGLQEGKHVVKRVNKYSSNWGTKYTTLEEAEKIAEFYNMKHKERIDKNLNK